MIYIFVLFGSFFGILALLGVRLLLKNRNVRRFVHSMKQRTESAQQRGFGSVEQVIERPVKNPRTSAINLQKVRTLLREVEKHLAQKKYNDAERLLIQALTIDSDANDVRAQLALLYLSTNREQKAEAIYKELVSISRDASLFANLGLCCYRQGKYDQACSAYKEALELDPKSPERCAALGRAYIAARKFREAVPFLTKAIERMSRDTELLHLLADCYLQLGRPALAHQVYERIHRLLPYDEEVKEKMNALAHV